MDSGALRTQESPLQPLSVIVVAFANTAAHVGFELPHSPSAEATDRAHRVGKRLSAGAQQGAFPRPSPARPYQQENGNLTALHCSGGEKLVVESCCFVR